METEEMPTTGPSEFDRYRLHDTFVVIKNGKPVYGSSLSLIVAHKRKVLRGKGHADTLVERQKRAEKFAELETGQADDFRGPLVGWPALSGLLLEISEFGRDSVELRGPRGPGAPGLG
jgi:hypothetical protein